jgi:hypothetical protein
MTKLGESKMEALPVQLSNAIERDLASLAPEKLREACFD